MTDAREQKRFYRNGIKYLSEDIKGFEPRMALDGGNSGLETISKVIIKAKKLLKRAWKASNIKWMKAHLRMFFWPKLPVRFGGMPVRFPRMSVSTTRRACDGCGCGPWAAHRYRWVAGPGHWAELHRKMQ